MQDGCTIYMDSLHGIGLIMFHNHLDHFQKPYVGGRPKVAEHIPPRVPKPLTRPIQTRGTL